MKVRLGVEQNNIDDFINKIITKYHFDKKDNIDLKRTYLDMVKLIDAKAVYKINQHVTGIREIDDNQSAVVAMTLGESIDLMQEDMIKDQRIAEAYMMDCIADELLLLLYKEFNKTYARYHRRYVKKYVFIGDEIKLETIPEILADLYANKEVRDKVKAENDTSRNVESNINVASKDNSLSKDEDSENNQEIRANQYGNMVPVKSVVFYAILTEDPEETCEGICIGCNNINCENRIKAVEYQKNKLAKLGIEEEADPTHLNYGYQRIFGGNK